MQGRGGSFFGRRKGKTLKPSQREALASALPELLLDLTVPPPADLAALFAVSVDAVCLEIGFGGGEHLLHQARSSPGTGFIGIEPFQNGLAKAVIAIAAENIRNVRLFDRDAVLLLDWIPPASLARIDLLYPDPWPKTRHWKRRFVNPDNLDRIARVLAPEGVLRFASDVDAYVKWTLREASRHGKLAVIPAGAKNFSQPWTAWPGTRYEAKAVAAGRCPAYITFRKLQ